MLKKIFLKIMFWLFRKEYYLPLTKIEVDNMLTKIANTPGLERFPAYLDQCATTAKNQYLYSDDQLLKGSVFALISLKDQILEKKAPQIKKDLTDDEKVGIMRARGY